MKSVNYIPFQYTHPNLKAEMLQEFEKFYDEQKYILGPGLKRFETEYSDFNQTKYAVGVGNGHDALLIILKSLEIGRGDEVILPAHTFIATGLPVIHAGAKPVLVDIDKDTLNIDADNIEAKISKNTRAVIPVHLYGNPCEMEKITLLGNACGLSVIEDNAQAQGAEYQKQKTGSIGIMNFTSFYPTKNIGAFGDAGMITTNSKKLASAATCLRNYGKSKNGAYGLPGFNSRTDELQARLLSVKLKYLNDWNLDRAQIAELYELKLREVDEIRLQTVRSGNVNARHIFPVFTPERDRLKTYLKTKGIETLIHYEQPIHLLPSFSFLNHKKGDFPNAESACETELSLPLYPGLIAEDINYICEQIKNFFVRN